jgi:hypothetical protein
MLEDLEDPDGDEIMALRKTELMSGADPVRAMIKPGSDPDTVVRILRKVANWIEQKPEVLDEDYLAVTEDDFHLVNMGRISPRLREWPPLRSHPTLPIPKCECSGPHGHPGPAMGDVEIGPEAVRS